jgi:dodecin
MTGSIYKIIEVVGTSEKSWEDAVKNTIDKASKTVRNIRIAEVMLLDAKIDKQKIILYRARVRISFKLEEGEGPEFED